MDSKYFKTIYCMNLTNREDRWKETIEEVKKLGDNYKLVRYEAIKNVEMPAKGHSQTFRNIIQMAKDQSMEAILIGEDDLVLYDKSREMWELGISELPDDWDILSGGFYLVRDRKPVTAHLCKVSDFCASHFILIRNTAFDLILDYEKNNYKIKNIDRYIGKLSTLNKLNTYVVWPMISSQRAGYSDLRRRNVNDNTLNKRRGLIFLTDDDKIDKSKDI